MVITMQQTARGGNFTLPAPCAPPRGGLGLRHKPLALPHGSWCMPLSEIALYLNVYNINTANLLLMLRQ